MAKERKSQMNVMAGSSPLTVKNPAITEENEVAKTISKAEAKACLPKNINQADLNLSDREFKFLALYCSNGFDAEKASAGAGYKARTKAGYRAIAYALLQRKEVTDGVRLFVDMVIQPYKERLELELLNVYYRRATYAVDTFYREDGTAKGLREVGKEWKCCIDDIKTVRKGNNTCIVAYKLPDRDAALQALYRFVTGTNIDGTDTLPEESKKRMQSIYNTIIKANRLTVKPENVRAITGS